MLKMRQRFDDFCFAKLKAIKNQTKTRNRTSSTSRGPLSCLPSSLPFTALVGVKVSRKLDSVIGQ